MTSQRRLSRRTFVSTATAAGVTAAAANTVAADDGHAAHAIAHDHGAATSQLLAQQGGNIPTPREQTLVISQATVQVWDSFNPFIPNGESYQYGVSQLSRENLFYVNFEQGEVINWLATGFEYNDDFTELTLALRPEAMWNDGTPFTADDVVFTMDLLKNNANFFSSDPVRSYVDSATASDANTVVIALTEPNPRFHYQFTVGIVHSPIKIVPKHVWEGEEAGTFKNNPPVYTGPYVLDRTIPEQFMMVWRKNPDYWNSAELDPKPEFVIFRQFLPPDAEAEEFSRGAVDIPSLPYLNQQALLGTFDNWIAFNFNDPCPRGVWLNQDSPSGLFATAEGRWVISHLLDRETIGATIWQPPTTPAEYPWAPWEIHDRWTNADIKDQYPFTFDLARAAELLDGLGATMNGDRRQLNGVDLNLRLITPVQSGDPEFQIAQSLAANAAEVGIQIDVQSLPGSPFSDAYQLGEYDLTSHWLCGVALDPNQLYSKFLERQYKPIGERALQDNNETRTQVPELNDVALQLELVNPEDEANKPLFDEGLEAFLKNLPAMPSIYTIYPFAFSQEYWTGWPTNENPYNISANWWAQFLFVVGALEPVGAA